MQLMPIINAKMNRFKDIHELNDMEDSQIFERFVNDAILSIHQQNGSIDDEMLEAVCVGGSQDMGLDGVCIKLNGMLINSVDDAMDILKAHGRADIEFMFIQSKYRPSFKQDEYMKFLNGVREFSSDNHYQPRNEEVDRWIEIKDYLMSDDVILVWNSNPTVRLYYVAMGKWNDDPNIIACEERFKEDLKSMNSYGEVIVSYVDEHGLKKILDDNEDQFSAIINVMDTLSLTPVDDVDNSSIILCTADELMKLLVTDEGVLRKGLFNDNVRDYQGETTINQDIRHTIENDPKGFVLMNNGVTIICSNFNLANRKLTVKNPRIVNGCQTCSVLYHTQRTNHDAIKDVVVTCKIISTKSPDIANKVIRGTNRQNIVYEEAFECTREFHKQLEELFKVLSDERNSDKIYYERRSKQYNNNTMIKSFQKVSFRILIQSFVSVFLNEPHMGHKHESRLLQIYNGKIFVDSQSKEPYYVSSLIYVKTEKFLKGNDALKDARTYRSHIQMIIRILAGGPDCDINNEKKIDEYCDDLLKQIDSQESFARYASEAIKQFQKAVDLWVEKKGEGYRYGIKDSAEFTNFLLRTLSVSNHTQSEYRGVVTKIGIDRNNQFYGFIRNNRASFFFHSQENKGIDFESLDGKEVLFQVAEDPVRMKEKAVNVRLVSKG